MSQAEVHWVAFGLTKKGKCPSWIFVHGRASAPACAHAPAPSCLSLSCVCEMYIKQDSHLEEVGVYFTDASCTCAYQRASASCWPITPDLMQRRILFANEVRQRKGLRDMHCQCLLLLLVVVQYSDADAQMYATCGGLGGCKCKGEAAVAAREGGGGGAVEQTNAVHRRVPQHAS